MSTSISSRKKSRDRPGPPVAPVAPVAPIAPVAPVPPVLSKMVGDQTSEVTVRLIDPDHFSYHGPSEMIDDACRTALRVFSATAESYSEGSRSTENEGGKTIASRSWKMTKDIEGAVYRVTTLLLDGQDPVVMLEDTSEADDGRLVNALVGEFHRRGFRVESGTP